MITNKRIRIFSLIIDLLKRRGSASFAEMSECLSANDIDISKRSLERYIAELRNDFGVIDDCNRRTNRYSLCENNQDSLHNLLHLIQLISSSELFLESFKNRDKTLSYFAFETNQNYAGSVNIEPIYSAIIQSKIIVFDHENFEKSKISQYAVKPYLLKEYNSKWYLVCTLNDSGEVRTFGLDRITNIKITDDTFEKTDQNRISQLFDFLIGLVYDLDQPTNVEISVTLDQAKYFKRSPLHTTQKIISETDIEVIFSYYLIPNRELQRLFLGYSSQIKVLKPQWFVEQMREQIEAMRKKYEK